MEKDFINLLEEFKRISYKGYIRGVRQSYGSIGLTFERELGKSPDSLYYPDYGEIEIKCTSRFSHYPLYLFTVAFDGPDANEIMRIANAYGNYDKDYPDKKVLFTKLDCKYFALVNDKYNFILDFDKDEKRVYLCVYDLNRNLIERRSYINFQTIIDHLKLKLNKLAFIYASKKKDNFDYYYRFYRIIFYKLRSEEVFLSLLEDGTIKVGLVSRISKSGSDKGRYRNKNLEFEIDKYDIEKLFEKIYEYNLDYR